MFDQIASDWSRKRLYPWQPFISLTEPIINSWDQENLSQNQKEGYLFLDLGCGSGRHSKYFQNKCSRLIELDISKEMLQVHQEKTDKIQASLTQLPFRKNIFDGEFSVAAIHHVKTIEKRRKIINEMNLIGKNHAIIIITVWRFYQKKYINEFRRQTKHFPPYLSILSDGEEIGDIIIPWTISQNKEKITILRFYHLFRAAEFRKLISNFEKIQIKVFGKVPKKDNFFFAGLIKKNE